MSIDAAALVVLSKFISGEDTDLQPGDYEVDTEVTLRIQGSVKKAEPGFYTPTSSIPLKTVLALVLERAGFQRENLKNLLVEVCSEALTQGKQVEERLKDRLKDMDAAMAHVQSILGKLPPQERQGATKVSNFSVDEVEPLSLESVYVAGY